MSSLRVAIACAVGLAWCAPGPAICAEPSEAAADRFESAAEASRRILAPRLEIHPGLSATVAVDGRVVWSEGLGWADRAAGQRATPETRFRLYSASKALTGTLAVRLRDQGRLELDAPIHTYLEGLPKKVAPLTIRQLLGHLGGVRHYKRGEWMTVSTRRCDTARASLSDFIDDAVQSKPGRSFSYTSFGFVLASAVLEAAGEAPFIDVLRREILEPAGMTATSLDTPSAYDDATATFYWEERDGSIGIAPPIDNSCKAGGGGLLTTSEDLVRFGMALLSGALVSDQGLELITTSQRDAKGEATGYSLGWGVSDDRTRIAHSGGSPGGRSYLLVDLESRIVIALMSNYDGEGFHPEAKALLAEFKALASEAGGTTD